MPCQASQRQNTPTGISAATARKSEAPSAPESVTSNQASANSSTPAAEATIGRIRQRRL
jgi:hypothetical protein